MRKIVETIKNKAIAGQAFTTDFLIFKIICNKNKKIVRVKSLLFF